MAEQQKQQVRVAGQTIPTKPMTNGTNGHVKPRQHLGEMPIDQVMKYINGTSSRSSPKKGKKKSSQNKHH